MPPAIPDLHPLKDVAARLHVTPRRLRDHLKTYPCGRKLGRQILFTDSDIIGLINSLECFGGRHRPYTPANRRSYQQAQTSDTAIQDLLLRLSETKTKKPKRRVP